MMDLFSTAYHDGLSAYNGGRVLWEHCHEYEGRTSIPTTAWTHVTADSLSPQDIDATVEFTAEDVLTAMPSPTIELRLLAGKLLQSSRSIFS